MLQGSADSNYSQPSSDLSLDEEKENLRREKERQALSQLEKARVRTERSQQIIIIKIVEGALALLNTCKALLLELVSLITVQVTNALHT